MNTKFRNLFKWIFLALFSIAIFADNSSVLAESAEKAERSSFSIRYIDVGQADAALVQCDGKYMLIDGGNKNASRVMYTVLKNEGIEHLEIIVGTHAHEDHIGGIPGALNYATAGITLCPVANYDGDAFRDFEKYVYNKNTKKFHYSWCSSADDIKEKNRGTYTGTRNEMINKGYDPCKRCNP